MSTSNKTNYENTAIHYKIWLSTIKGEGIMGDGKWRLLKTIDEKGSLKAASENLGISYRKAWGDIKKAEKLLGFELTEKHRGGKHGGNSILTENGGRLVEAYKELHKKINISIEKAFVEFKDRLAT